MKYIKSKSEIDKAFADNPRYASWEKRNEKGELESITFGFYKTMGKYYLAKRKSYWEYDMPDDFTVVATEKSVIESHGTILASVDSLTHIIWKQLVQTHGQECADDLKLKIHETDPKNYNREAEQIDKWLEEAKNNPTENGNTENA